MDWQDEAFVLSARPHGETGAIAEFLTRSRGRVAAHVAGGISRRIKPLLQPGSLVEVSWRSRLEGQLGSATLEPLGGAGAALLDLPLALAGLTAASAMTAAVMPEKEPHPGVFEAFSALLSVLEVPQVWPAIYVRFEMGLLEATGFGLDLSRCAATGSPDNLVYVSPRTGRAVSREAGAAYHDRLLALPGFLLSSQHGLGEGDIEAGLRLTGHFLETFVMGPLNRPLPPARLWMIDRLLQETGIRTSSSPPSP